VHVQPLGVWSDKDCFLENTPGDGEEHERARASAGPSSDHVSPSYARHDGLREPVTIHTDRLLTLVTVNPLLPGFNPQNNSGRPPWCIFVWGSFVSFKAVVESVNLTFTYFSSDGRPLRAKAVLALKQYDDLEKWPQNPTSGTPYPHSVRWLLPGQTLDRIAAEVYGDAGKWRLIADANGIHDPLNLPEGMALMVPSVEAASRG
jgi:hypothetical protein